LGYHPAVVSAVPEMPGPLGRALRQLQAGGMVVVCDDPDREDEGDLCMAAEFVTAEAIVSALAPGNAVVTMIVGYSTCGSAATGSCR